MPGAAAGAGKQAGRAAWPFALLLVVALGDGCKKSEPEPSLLPPPPPETIARVRWLGKQRLAADTNAAFVMGIWNLAESKRLEAQTLDKLAAGLLASNQLSVISNQLSAAASQLSATNHPASVTNHPLRLTGAAALLRPLLDDLLQQESYLEVRQATNQPGDLAFAIRLSEERARLWETNLAAAAESLTGSRAAAAPGRTNGWQLGFIRRPSSIDNHSSPVPRSLELLRAGEWTVVGLGSQTNALAAELLAHIELDGRPFTEQQTDFWLYADVDLRRVASALLLGWQLPAGLPRLTVSIIGDDRIVHTWGELNFPEPLPFGLEPWTVPTNLIHEPLASFTAVQGVAPWLSSLKTWRDLQLGAPPNQVYFWAQRGNPFMSYCAARLPNASNEVSQLAERLVQKANPWIATNGLGTFERATNFNGAIWEHLPYATPYLKSVSLPEGDFAFGGLVEVNSSTNRPPPAKLLEQVFTRTNLVAYNWELTGPRIEQWLYFSQFLRLALHQAQVPPKSASLEWLIALETRLGNCVTTVTRTGPAQLTLRRGSSLGFTTAELDWLADWLESPQFPRGLNTFLGEPTPLPRKIGPRHDSGSRTNSAPPADR